jgi:hypothetical protein
MGARAGGLGGGELTAGALAGDTRVEEPPHAKSTIVAGQTRIHDFNIRRRYLGAHEFGSVPRQKQKGKPGIPKGAPGFVKSERTL